MRLALDRGIQSVPRHLNLEKYASRSVPDEVLQGLMHGAIGHNLVDAVAGAAESEAEVVRHAQQLPKVHTCI